MRSKLNFLTFQVQLSMTNKSYKVYTIEATISVRSTTYNGVSTAVVRHDTVIKTLGPRKCMLIFNFKLTNHLKIIEFLFIQ